MTEHKSHTVRVLIKIRRKESLGLMLDNTLKNDNLLFLNTPLCLEKDDTFCVTINSTSVFFLLTQETVQTFFLLTNMLYNLCHFWSNWTKLASNKNRKNSHVVYIEFINPSTFTWKIVNNQKVSQLSKYSNLNINNVAWVKSSWRVNG